MGAQGPGCAPPMPEGGSEDRGPRSAAGPNQTPPGPRGPEPRTGVGSGGAYRGRAWRGPGREGAETSAPLTPTPSPGMHARPAARGPGNTPGPRAGPGLLARVAGVRGRGGFSRAAGPGRRAPWKGWVLRAPAALRLCPREAQRTEGRGPRRARIRHLRGHVALSHEREWAVGALTGGGPREAQGGRAPRPPRPSPQPQAQACTPDRPLGVLETLRAPGPGQVCWPGLPVCGDGAASAGLPALAGAPRGKVRPAGWTRHIRAKRKRSVGFLNAPGGNRLHLRSYHPERARCLLIVETKQELLKEEFEGPQEGPVLGERRGEEEGPGRAKGRG
ncbi:unnamed protein product [Rangifer tarandus platyrhynchus]|uniref:Uncharacterized protein n=1 Tax=Rangifer tarandus platyrhynchus TaxID=3082113 RepID=A0ABN8XPI9_RANTA|nr:unnamed protein product [Rangifer tarandus platyrhynchus]CAI9689570.1 unnamed protein product [Rangifer tarandus platyrhynchus]